MKYKNPNSQDDDESLENGVYKLERQVDAMSKFNIQEAVDKSIEARLKQIDFSKDVPGFKKIKQEKATKQSMPKHPPTKFNKAALAMYDQKDKLYKMMDEFKAYNKHPAHKALFNALVVSLHPSVDPNKDSKKKKKKDHDVSSSKKTKDQTNSSKDEEPIVDKVVNVDDRSQDNTAPRQDMSKWFKQSPRPETPETRDLEWSKDPNANAGPKQDWHHLKKDKLTKADLEGPVFKFFKGNCISSIELEYHLEQRYLAFSNKLDWANPEGDRIPQDFNKPLHLLGASGCLYIPVEFFFNKDLEYLRFGNLEENKYTASFTKAKAARYELYRIEEMIPNLWSPSKVSYDKDVAYGISH
ncbi:hypothetical protein Tco_0638996 [Tanacetum coccineum]